MRFLALDTAKSGMTGWASWATGDAQPAYGSFKVASQYSSDGQAMQTIFKEIDVVTAFGIPDIMAVEAPANAGNWAGGRKFSTTVSLVRISGACAFWATNRAVRRFSEIDKAVWFPPFIGANQRPPKGEAKSYCIARCKSLGLKPRDDNEADAIGILDYIVSLENIIPPWRAENILVSTL